jgi:hypothetical protein
MTYRMQYPNILNFTEIYLISIGFRISGNCISPQNNICGNLWNRAPKKIQDKRVCREYQCLNIDYIHIYKGYWSVKWFSCYLLLHKEQSKACAFLFKPTQSLSKISACRVNKTVCQQVTNRWTYRLGERCSSCLREW